MDYSEERMETLYNREERLEKQLAEPGDMSDEQYQQTKHDLEQVRDEIETVADEQMWAFQKDKARRRAAGDPATNGPWIRYVTRLAELVAVGDLPV